MNWTTIIDERAKKQLNKIPAKDYERIRMAINAMELDPFFGDIEKLGGEENSWRKRVGNYRIFYEIYDHRRLIYISEIQRRTSNTY